MSEEMSRIDERLRPALSRRKPVSVTREALVRTEPLPEAGGGGLPLVMQPAVEGLDPITWALNSREAVGALLSRHGGVLFRNFKITSPSVFEQFVVACSAELLQYKERSSPRTQVSQHLYTSTDYPPAQSIFLHNENSYQHAWPLKLFFYCAAAAERGGETPIADCRRVLARISPAVRRRFAEKGWMLVRNFGEGLSLSWQSVFQTEERAAVEEYCRRAGIETEWRGERLRTRQVRRAITTHPKTGAEVWFNHATFFHVSTLDPEIREGLLAGLGEDELPNNTFYGDGSPIEPAVLEELREAYRRETVSFGWREGDVLMLDNMLVAHGRAPYEGTRRVLVAMAEPYSPAAEKL